jgi:metal-responsive CopG/Arc/MetJ family transcriptional regulator
MGRINVFLKAKLLKEIDREAKDKGTTRSALIQTALEKYIGEKRRIREENQKRKNMEEAARKIDALARKLRKWNPQTTVRKFRDTNVKSGS